MPRKDEQRLRVGVLGCGPIAQAAHFESCTKARNAELYAICDVADDLRERMAATHGAGEILSPTTNAMLADPDLDAVIIATSDAFQSGSGNGARGGQACPVREAGRRDRRGGRGPAAALLEPSGKVLQVGHMKRFDPGIEAAKAFIDEEMGALLAYKGWYCDSTHRYAMTDAVQPLIVTSAQARKPSDESQGRPAPLLHARAWQPPHRHRAALFGPIEAVEARLTRAVRRTLLVRQRRLRRRHGRPSRPDRRRAHGLARGIPDLWRARQRARRRPTTLGTTRAATSTFSARPRRLAPHARRRRPFLSPAGRRLRRRHAGRRADGRRHARRRHSVGPRHGGDRAVGGERAAGRVWRMSKGAV